MYQPLIKFHPHPAIFTQVLDIFGAIRYNLLFVLSLPLIVILSYAEIMRNKKPALYIKLHKAKFIWFIFGTVILWWIIRNIFDI